MTLQQLADRSHAEPVATVPLSRTVTVGQAATRPVVRLRTKIPWFDMILGGGLVRGSVVMLHGEPGAGKSTLLAQAASGVRGSLYVSAEESIEAVAARAVRLGCRSDMDLLTESDMASALATAGRAPLVVIDSIQMMRPDALEATRLAVEHARRLNVCLVLVCQEIKAGTHAGPRAIEHLIDCAIKMRRGSIVAEKNRFGPTGQVVAIQMTEGGLVG